LRHFVGQFSIKIQVTESTHAFLDVLEIQTSTHSLHSQIECDDAAVLIEALSNICNEFNQSLFLLFESYESFNGTVVWNRTADHVKIPAEKIL